MGLGYRKIEGTVIRMLCPKAAAFGKVRDFAHHAGITNAKV